MKAPARTSADAAQGGRIALFVAAHLLAVGTIFGLAVMVGASAVVTPIPASLARGDARQAIEAVAMAQAPARTTAEAAETPATDRATELATAPRDNDPPWIFDTNGQARLRTP